MLCGHERETLSYVLNFAASDHRVPVEWSLTNWGTVAGAMLSAAAVKRVGLNYEQATLAEKQVAAPRANAWFAIHDPAKLAELMAEELRRRGVSAVCITMPREYPMPRFHWPLEWHLMALPNHHWPNVEPRIDITPNHWKTSIELDMPQARAALIRLMQLPEGTPAQGVLKALEVA